MNLAETQKISGWCSPQKQTLLHSIVLATRPSVSLEIGIWCGKSLLPIAIAHKEVGFGRVIAVDPWNASASAIGQLKKDDFDWWKDQAKHDWAYEQFCANIASFGVKDFVDLKRMNSLHFICPDGIGLFHCDGNHGRRALSDVKENSSKVLIGGFVVLDDLNWTGGAVSSSAKWIEENGFKRLFIVKDKETENEWGVWQRIK